MHIKFLARGTGSAQADYLLGARDATGQPRAGVEILSLSRGLMLASATIAAPHTPAQCLYRLASNPLIDCDSPSQ